MTEDWRPVVGWEGLYEVSRSGEVRSLPRVVTRHDGTVQAFTGKLMGRSVNSSGYFVVRLSTRARRVSALVHRLVALAFLGPAPKGKNSVNHIDGNKRNPDTANLEWVSDHENKKHAWSIGLRDRSDLPVKYGEQANTAKLTAEIVTTARIRHKAGASVRSLAREYGVDKKTMRKAIDGSTWKHIPILPTPPAKETR